MRIVREQADLADPKVAQDLRTYSIVPEVIFESEFQVGFDRVEPLILEGVGFDLIAEANPAPLLMEVNDHTCISLDNLPDGFLQLLPAVASARTEHVPGKTLRMESH